LKENLARGGEEKEREKGGEKSREPRRINEHKTWEMMSKIVIEG